MTDRFLVRLFAACFGTACFGGLIGARAFELPPGFHADILATNLETVTAMAVAPDGAIFFAEQSGRIRLWKNGALLEHPVLTLHVTDFWERGLIGLTLHPDFPRTPQLFAIYVTDRPVVHHVPSRFTLEGDIADPASEKVLLEGDNQSTLGGFQPGGHQGGPLRFGPDGKLYVSIGEQTAGEPSQKLDTLQGKILRLNPDGTIPEDNPFLAKTTGKYRSIAVLGVRNAFGLAVQPETSRLFFTDVGASAFEEVNEFIPGANYGWPRAEGFSTNRNFKNPLYAYPPYVGQSICGGTFYPRQPNPNSPGLAFPAKWRGRFFFVDFMKHWVRALDPANPTNVLFFAGGFNGPIAIESSPDNALLVLDRGTIWRDPKKFAHNSGSLVRIRYSGESTPLPSTTAIPAALGLPNDFSNLPRALSSLALFGALTNRAGQDALQSYELNVPEWTPGVVCRRFFALPRGTKLQFRRDDDWELPPGTVIVQHFEIIRGSSAAAAKPRPLETRLVVVANPRSYAASFRWRDDASDADLVEDTESVSIRRGDGSSLSWILAGLEPAWNASAFYSPYTVHLTTRQLNRPVSGRGNQIESLNQRGLLADAPSRDSIEALPRLAHWADENRSPEIRVRSYLDVHCAPCHQPGGPSRGAFDARLQTALGPAGMLNAIPLTGDLGVTGAKIIAPGSPEKSVLYLRANRTDFFRMPPVAYHNERSPIVPVLERWIRSLNEQLGGPRRSHAAADGARGKDSKF